MIATFCNCEQAISIIRGNVFAIFIGHVKDISQTGNRLEHRDGYLSQNIVLAVGNPVDGFEWIKHTKGCLQFCNQVPFQIIEMELMLE